MGKQKITYEEMLSLLKAKQYKAKDDWQSIEDALELDKGISSLPTYKAPDNLWDGIEASLDSSVESTQKTQTNNYKTYFIITFFLLLAMMLFTLTNMNKGNDEDKFKYKSEKEDIEMQNNFVQLDDEIDDVLMYIESNSFLFEDEKFAEFKKQLKELNDALEQINEMQGNYGTDESSNRLMARMEREKVNLIKSMIESTS